jgi:hypothetical protein
MPDTIRERVISAVEAAMQTLSGVTVERNRDTEVSTFPFINVLDGGQDPDYGTHGLTRYVMTVTLELFVSATTEAGLGPALNALYGQVVQALYADATLAGLTADRTEAALTEPDLSRAEGIGPTMGAALDVTLDYWTPFGDPFTLAP